MNEAKVNEAVFEAKRFIKKAEELQRNYIPRDGSTYSPSKESGSVKRSSMDLTRVLANLRSSDYGRD